MYNGGYIKDFGELKKWWMEHGVHQDEKDRKTLYIAYGYFEANPNWDAAMEEEYMTKNNVMYDNTSRQRVQEGSTRKGYEIKGCIAKNISTVKHELVKQLQKAGRIHEEGITIAKNWPKNLEKMEADKKRRKKVSITLMEYQ